MNEPMVAGLILGIFLAVVLMRMVVIERRLNRLSRLEAKVDALLKHAGVDFDPYRDVPPAVREALDRGEYIMAIKRFREVTGAGLKDAKEVVDEVRRRRAPVR
jgi:hypothetical protein